MIRHLRARRGGADFLAAVACAVLAAGCTVGPDYRRPDAPVPSAWREAPPVGGAWKTAEPSPADASAATWSAFRDPTLSALVDEASRANQTIAQADANHRAAQALVTLARSALFPAVGVSAGVSRSRAAGRTTSASQDAHNIALVGSWEPDLWGGVRRSIESASASAESSDASLAGARLSIQAQVAQAYLALRVNDELRDLLAASVEAYDRALKLSQAQFRAGTVSRSDVALATAQLKATQASLTDTQATRVVYEHAIAVLLGKAPADFALPKAPLAATLPVVPLGVPSSLLERRPDISTAERAAAAANANIGVAKAAFYPQLTLAASGGDSLASFGQFFTAPGRVWSLGATLAQTLFDGGARRARTDQAVAYFDAAVAAYRQTVLAGFQEVEDNIATLRVLEDEQTSEDEAVSAARDAERIALSQYRAGTTTYLSVVTAQNTALTNARLALSVRGRRYAASVALIRAVGGGWTDAALGAPLADAGTPTSLR